MIRTGADVNCQNVLRFFEGVDLSAGQARTKLLFSASNLPTVVFPQPTGPMIMMTITPLWSIKDLQAIKQYSGQLQSCLSKAVRGNVSKQMAG